MDTQVNGQVRLLSDLEAGALFLLSDDDNKTYISIKSFRRSDQGIASSFVILSPPHPAFDGRIASFDDARLRDHPVYEIVGAKFCAPFELHTIKLEQYRHSAGKVYIFGSTLFLGIIHHLGQSMLLNVESGELLDHAPQRHCAKVGSWEIIQIVNHETIKLGSSPPA